MKESRRIERLKTEIREAGWDAVVVYPGPNTVYLAGFEGEPHDRHAVLVVPRDEEPWFAASEKAADGIRRRSGIETVRGVVENDPALVVNELVDGLGDADALALGPRVPFSVVEPLRAAVPGVTFESAEPVLSALRLRKDDEELAALERSAGVADAVSEGIRALGESAIGRTEAQVAAEIRSRLHERGARRPSFDVVVAAGKTGANPYHRHGDRRIEPGEPVIIDFGAIVDGYASDQTRTVVFGGTPSARFREAHAAVLEALDAGVDAVEVGEPVASVHRAVTETIAERGFADRLRHATGHGVGVDAHEAPTVDAESDRTLERGMVFSVEPGLYVEGEFGVRVEDIVAVTPDGGVRLNRSPRTWRPL